LVSIVKIEIAIYIKSALYKNAFDEKLTSQNSKNIFDHIGT